MAQHKFKGDLVERHEVTIKGTEKTITFSNDSKGGRLVICQEAEGKKPRPIRLTLVITKMGDRTRRP